MRFTSAIFAAVALATSVFAQETTAGFAVITAPTKDEKLQAGSQYTIVWQPGSEAASTLFTITLMQGASQGLLQPGAVIAAGVANSGSYKWSVPTGLNFALYGIKISLDSAPTTFQYSNPFQIVGGSSSSSSSVSSSASSSVSSTATSSPSSTVTGTTTSVASPTSTLKTTTIADTFSSSGPYTTVVPTSVNGTTTAAPTTVPTGPAGNGTRPSGPTTSAPATNPTNGAIGKAATGGFAVLGGMVLALLL